MELSPQDIARCIDISTVQAQHGEAEIRELVQYAREYGFIAVHALPCWTKFLSELLSDRDDILVGGPVGFPSGGHRTETKVFEAKQLIADGLQEMDLMMNIGMLRSGRYAYVEEEIRAIVETAGTMPVKVILEVYHLTDDEIKQACELCINAGAAFVKTGTGWTPSGATLDVVSLITSFVGDAIKVKASGGVRGLEMFTTMYNLGVARFGINVNASIEILRECAALPG
ncbi:deoxyribose-phosphate aldolase, partial [candidate division KSB3 bacterium]|nr:deoxyribose-phosphate aldolase [candidate division KSB3 bacterium]MBD3325934.1 deoxyribose-phosphate aldolase [candidate division KSB3 bacterium]